MTSNVRLMNRTRRDLQGRLSSPRNSASGTTSSNRQIDATYFLHITNQAIVKSEYERVFEDFSKSYEERFHRPFYSIVTILYNGGISLVANKEFAGYPAGENLAPLITNNPIYDNIVLESGENPIIAPGFNTPSNAGGFLGIPLDYISMTKDGVEFCIPMGEHKLIEDEVTFELFIPVKVVLYLTWLNNMIGDPDAPVPFKDEVLHCSFTTKYGLN